MARRVAHDIPDGAYVNLGIGIPELVAKFVPPGRELVFQTENGLLGKGPPPAAAEEDPELINAGNKPVTAVAGAAIVALLLLTALFADVIAPQSPTAADQSQTFQRPSWDYPLGTDQLGRDMLSRIVHGSRISLAVGVSSVLLALFIGVPLGLVAGYHGGRTDTLIMRVMDLILAFPIYLLAIILMVMFTPTAGLIGTMKVTGAIAIVRIPIYARLVRGSVLSVKEKEYIEASRALGVPVRVLYLSNAEQYWNYGREYRDNLAAFDFDERAVVLRTVSSRKANHDYRYNVHFARDYQARLRDPTIRQVYQLVERRRIEGRGDIDFSITGAEPVAEAGEPTRGGVAPVAVGLATF